ncbi:hypothetical protein FRC16_005201 [Serendipita sp. 398]|nr:hypothetical protein FRC16_005201 [Serendipita sp. 398]
MYAARLRYGVLLIIFAFHSTINKDITLLTFISISLLSLTHHPSIHQQSNREPYLTCHPIAKVKRQHNASEALYRNIAYYLQNHLPIRLLQLSDMVLVDRAVLQEQIGDKVTKGSFFCKESSCVCIAKVKDELKYSILSHRWGFPELTFSEFGKLHEPAIQSTPPSLNATVAKMEQLWGTTRFKPSLDKLLHFREVSAERQCKYGWVDTICINKESSAELDESIRSMYAWYRDSHICIIHLSQTRYHFHMRGDAWFTRGWTLQELLAPKQIKFFSSSWKEITRRKNDKDLSDEEQEAAKKGQDKPPLWSAISEVTGIPIDDLLDFKPGLYEIGKRMNWASRRTTTRVEDMAYCLIGIFRVNLSISYGEKEGAFYRLQAEIMQNSNDQSLFDWRGRVSAYNSMFAASPECFSRPLGFLTNNRPPANAAQNSSGAVNFERHVSRILYYKSEFPNWSGWRGSSATAFTILAPLSTAGKYGVLLLKQVGVHQHYKCLKIVEDAIGGELPARTPSEILIK